MTLHETAVEQPIDYEHFLDTYGLGPEEINAVVSFNGHEGTVGEMLEDKNCPVGSAVAEAYTEQGIQGVEAKLDALRTIFPSLTVRIGERIHSFHDGKTDRKNLLGSVAQEATPDFLA